MASKITYGLIGILSLLAGFGGSIFLDQDTLDNTYFCTSNEKIAVFESLSSTSKTGYWTEEGIERRSVCRNGIWMKFSDYLESTGKSINLLSDDSFEYTMSEKYLCNQKECIPI